MDLGALLQPYVLALRADFSGAPGGLPIETARRIRLRSIFVEPACSLVSATRPTPVALRTLVVQPQSYAVLAGPCGSGRSTVAHRLVLAAIAAATAEEDEICTPGWPAAAPIPVVFEPGDLAAVSDSSAWSDMLAALQHRHGLAGGDALLTRVIQQGAALVVLDDADTVASAALTALLDMVRPAGNRVLLTARTPAFAEQLPGAPDCYLLAPLDERRADLLVERWHAELKAAGLQPAGRAADSSVLAIQTALRAIPGMAELARTPRLLVYALLAAWSGLNPTSDRAILFGRILEWLLDGVSMPAHMHMASAGLQPLALALHQQRSDAQATLPYATAVALANQGLAARSHQLPTELAAAEPLLDRALAAGILTRDGAQLGMPVLPLRHYLVARALIDEPDFVARAYELRAEAGWRQPLLLAMGLLRRRGGTTLARALLRQLLDDHGNAHALVLAAECLLELGDRAGPAHQMREPVQQGLVQLIEGGSLSLRERITASLVLGRLGDPRTAGLEPILVRVPGGPFVMGRRQSPYDDEGPQRRVTIPTFQIGRHPVTNAEYARFLAARPGAVERPRYWHVPDFNNPSQPVVGITWFEARAYCEWLTDELHARDRIRPPVVVRLPTEAEWEKAASWDPVASRQRIYPWGDDWHPERANTAEGREDWVTAPIGCYPAGVSAYGVHDMIGNVWEWTASEYASYPGTQRPFRERGSYVIRGSSCMLLPPHVRCTYRSRLPGSFWRFHLGFRIVIGAVLPE